ncbi:MAG: hypothetical protein N3D20_02605 [Candidatus Pacearchaeota archaeon]|nr:hypothetical protein [Candidatus Pacearchaeota archaeon]
MSNYFIAICTLLGTIIGAGILAIPYVVSKSGFAIGLFHLVFLAIAITLIMLYLGEIALRTKKSLHLSGYAEKYLGKKGKIVMFISLAFGIYSALVAYLIGESESISYLLFNSTQYSLIIAIIFWFFMSFILYLGFKVFKNAETIAVTFVFAMIILIIAFTSNKIDISNLHYLNPNNFFAPFGVILFAYLAFSIMPEIEKILSNEKQKMKKTIITAYFIAFLIYAIFTICVIGFRGTSIPEIATIGLGKPFVILGILTMFTAYLALSTALIDSYNFDFKHSRKISWLLTIFVPIIIFLALEFFNKASFVKVISIGGAISGTLTAILILIMAKKAKSYGDITPNYSIPYSIPIAIILALIFIIGTIIEIINTLT